MNLRLAIESSGFTPAAFRPLSPTGMRAHAEGLLAIATRVGLRLALSVKIHAQYRPFGPSRSTLDPTPHGSAEHSVA